VLAAPRCLHSGSNVWQTCLCIRSLMPQTAVKVQCLIHRLGQLCATQVQDVSPHTQRSTS
jgi:hypothetical protein